jgi:RNA polymerase sigma factor (sigma-70 family)
VDTGGLSQGKGRPSIEGRKAISTVTAAPALRREGDDITDHDLVARVRAGDERAFERLYTRYHRRIASYIQGMVHDHARAEDIAQDVFMSALRRMRETDRPIAFKPWVYEIAKNACIDQFRRARRAEEVSMDADDGLGSADYGRLVSSGPTPDVAVDHKQQIDHLRGAFGGLSETHHEILVMRELEGLSYREIGEKLGMTRPAVESTLFRARRRLTEEYDQLVTGERCARVQQIIAAADGSALGARDRRRVARHVSYCQPCLRHARVSGLDAGDLVHRPIRQKIAAILPLPAFLKERWGGSDAGASLAHWSAQASGVDPGVVASWGKAAATAATIALAGVGAGVATNDSGQLRGALGGLSLESITGGDGRGSADERRASGSDSRASGSGAAGVRAGGSGSGASARGADGRRGTLSAAAGSQGAGQAGGSNGGGTAGDSSGSASGSGDGSASGDAGGADGTASAGEQAGSLLPNLGSTSGGGGGGGGGDGRDDGGGGGSLGDVASGLPAVEVPTGGGDSPGNSGGQGEGNGDGDGAGDGGSPVEVLGDKSAEVIGTVIGE